MTTTLTLVSTGGHLIVCMDIAAPVLSTFTPASMPRSLGCACILKVVAIRTLFPLLLAASYVILLSCPSVTSHPLGPSQTYQLFQSYLNDLVCKCSVYSNSDNREDYAKPVSMLELTEALCRADDSTAGPDQVHYQFLKHLPGEAIDSLLRLFNGVWLPGDFPGSH
jgi:hypothetical protein